MSKARLVMIIGIWTAVLPYLGFPYSWKNFLMIATGAALLYLSYILYRDAKNAASDERNFDNFSENRNFLDN